MPEPTTWNDMAAIIDETAAVLLDEIPPERVSRSPRSHADEDADAFQEEFGTTYPAGLIGELAGIYILESGFELRALASLLRTNNLAATYEVVVRSVVERVGKINWILDIDSTPRVRGIRAFLEYLVAFQHYRRAVDDLRPAPDIRKEVEKLFRGERKKVESWLTLDAPLQDPCDINSGRVADISKWTCEGEAFPTFEKLAAWAMLDDDNISKSQAVGTYGALSCFSHPNFVASREVQSQSAGRIAYSYNAGYVDKLVRLAVCGSGNALNRWIAYYDYDHDRIHALLDTVLGKWEELSASIVDQHGDSGQESS
jgi:hypothetical protein